MHPYSMRARNQLSGLVTTRGIPSFQEVRDVLDATLRARSTLEGEIDSGPRQGYLREALRDLEQARTDLQHGTWPGVWIDLEPLLQSAWRKLGYALGRDD